MCSFKGFCQKCLDRGERHVYLRRAKLQDKRMLCAFDGKIRDIGSGLLKRRSGSEFSQLTAVSPVPCTRSVGGASAVTYATLIAPK